MTESSLSTFLRITTGLPKRAGDKITCLRCHGFGYTREGLAGDVPVECARCHGAGKQTVKPHA